MQVPGGDLAVELGDTVRLGGPVVHVFDVDVGARREPPAASTATSYGPRRAAGGGSPRPRSTSASSSSGRCSSAPASACATPRTAEASLDELALLTDTAGAEPVELVLQRRDRPDPATYIGTGKAEELRELAEALDIDVVVFDDELTPAQQRNLEKLFDVDVVDRVALILDIFAQHAHSQEGMVQVELAQLRYRLPRLRGRGTQLSQQGRAVARGGIVGTVVPVRRSSRSTAGASCDASRKLEKRPRPARPHPRDAAQGPPAARARDASRSSATRTRASRRCSTGSPHADVLVEDRLFSTLDPTTRRLRLPGGETVLLSDTVGFVRRLPHQLVEAFRSTLEEVVDADLLVHVVDGSAHDAEDQIDAVRTVLREIGADAVPELLVVNKIDVADPQQVADDVLARITARSRCRPRTGEGVDEAPRRDRRRGSAR